MNRIYFALIALFWLISVHSQNATGIYQRGFVHLKNGTILKGSYIYTPNMEKIQVVSGQNTYVFNASEVEFISKNKPPRIAPDQSETFNGSHALPKFFNFTEVGILVGNPDNDQSAPMVIGSSFNYSFLKNISFGAGVGVEFFKETYMPVTLNLMYKFRDARFSPFALLQGGYQVPLEDSRTVYNNVVPDYVYSSSYWPGYWPNNQMPLTAEGGWLANPAVGFISQTRSGYSFSFSVGYRFHRLRYSGDNSYKIDVDYNRLSVKLGLFIN